MSAQRQTASLPAAVHERWLMEPSRQSCDITMTTGLKMVLTTNHHILFIFPDLFVVEVIEAESSTYWTNPPEAEQTPGSRRNSPQCMCADSEVLTGSGGGSLIT